MTDNPLTLPHFVIIGAMKSGTTTLYRYLDLHPDVDMSRDKETDFFVEEKTWKNGLNWYAAQFTGEDKVRGEASPNYTKLRDFPGVPERMAQLVPDAKLIYIVRDPVKRAVSQFKHSYILGTLDADPNSFHGTHEYGHIMDASLYARQLAAFYEYYPKEAVLVLDFDDLITDPQAVMDQVFDHVGVSRQAISDLGAQNDSNELSKIPAPVLRFVQSPLGKQLAALVSREMRDKVRGLLARGKQRQPPKFPDTLMEAMKSDLTADIDQFRSLTGKDFSKWLV